MRSYERRRCEQCDELNTDAILQPLLLVVVSMDGGFIGACDVHDNGGGIGIGSDDHDDHDKGGGGGADNDMRDTPLSVNQLTMFSLMKSCVFSRPFLSLSSFT